MKRGNNVHVILHPDGWAVKVVGNDRVTKVFRRQLDAIDFAEGMAKIRHSDTKIHGRDGKIRSGNSYGNDPFPPRDKK